MIRFRSGRTRRALDHIQPAHLARIRIAAFGEVAGIASKARESCVEEIGIERKDYVCFREVVARLHRLPECQLRAFKHIVAIYRLVNMPLGRRDTP